MKTSSSAATEDLAFKDLSNALLEILDRQVDTKGVKDRSSNDRKASASQLREKAAEITETLKASGIPSILVEVFGGLEDLACHHTFLTAAFMGSHSVSDISTSEFWHSLPAKVPAYH